MKRIWLFLYSFAFIMLSVALNGCGGSSSSSNSNGSNPPPTQTQLTSFAFLQQTPSESNYTTPMVGQFSVTGNDVQFSSMTAATDLSTGEPVSGAFGSIAVSVNGKEAVFDMYGGTVQAPSNQWDIWVADISGSTINLVQVTNDSYDDAMPQFSPDGSQIIFMSNRPMNGGQSRWQVFTRNIDGTGEHALPLEDFILYAGQPTYSPDGRKIAFAMTVGGFGLDEGIAVANSDGSNPHLITWAPSIGADELPAFSADGSKIFFNRINQSATPETEDIYMMPANGSIAIQPIKLTDGFGVNFDPVALNVAGLGERVLFSSNRSSPADATAGSFEIYSMKTDGTEISRLTNNALYDAFSTELYGATAGTAQQHVAAQPRLMHPPVHFPTLRPDWR